LYDKKKRRREEQRRRNCEEKKEKLKNSNYSNYGLSLGYGAYLFVSW
jgi:hypothetical protein